MAAHVPAPSVRYDIRVTTATDRYQRLYPLQIFNSGVYGRWSSSRYILLTSCSDVPALTVMVVDEATAAVAAAGFVPPPAVNARTTEARTAGRMRGIMTRGSVLL
jgi:hypothetical protein